MNPVVLAYLPPPTFPAAANGIANLRRFKRTWPLLAFSEHAYDEVEIRLPKSPEVYRDHAKTIGEKPNPWTLHNLAFLTGLRIAATKGVTHFIWWECDCRVGRDGWDGVVFDEFYNLGLPLAAAGSLVVYNPSNVDMATQRRWQRFMREHEENGHSMPIPVYGYKGAASTGDCCVFPNGALGVYSVAWLTKLFDISNTVNTAATMKAWDMELGLRLFTMLGHEAFDAVAYLNAVYSSYGDVLSTEEERLTMLRFGAKAAVHQIKSEANV